MEVIENTPRLEATKSQLPAGALFLHFFSVKFHFAEFLVVVEEGMADTILFIADDCVDVDVFHTPEDVSLDVRICLFQLGDHFFDFHAL